LEHDDGVVVYVVESVWKDYNCWMVDESFQKDNYSHSAADSIPYLTNVYFDLLNKNDDDTKIYHETSYRRHCCTIEMT